MRDSEVSYAVKAIAARPENESSWKYLQGLFPDDDLASLGNDTRVSSACLNVLGTEHNRVFALKMLLDLILHGFRAGQEFRDAVNAMTCPAESDSGSAESDSGSAETDSDLAKKLCDVLENEDPMRARYWSWRKSKVPEAGLI